MAWDGSVSVKGILTRPGRSEEGADEGVERLGDYSARGVVDGDTLTLRQLYDKRTPLYERWADTTVDAVIAAIHMK